MLAGFFGDDDQMIDDGPQNQLQYFSTYYIKDGRKESSGNGSLSVVIVLSKCNGGGKSIGNNSNIQHQNQKTNHYITNKSTSQHKAQISSCRSHIVGKFVTDWRN
ncbi:hypothetical protein CY35_10G080500 [Sphagnum magellanicum]|nr:hypothetical protein CY35_10G080500 [Sphagnum magellanicum]